jgi:mannose/fructose/N-acetylgalactosamine-specific phosphotransferase system component IIB
LPAVRLAVRGHAIRWMTGAKFTLSIIANDQLLRQVLGMTALQINVSNTIKIVNQQAKSVLEILHSLAPSTHIFCLSGDWRVGEG